MNIDNWLVEEEVSPIPMPNIRAVYIRLLEQMIEALRESQKLKLGEGEPEQIIPTYNLPTVVLAYLKQDKADNKAMAQMLCFRDYRAFRSYMNSLEMEGEVLAGYTKEK
jgi:hypothetical protein